MKQAIFRLSLLQHLIDSNVMQIKNKNIFNVPPLARHLESGRLDFMSIQMFLNNV